MSELEKIQAAELARSRFNNAAPTGRIGGPGSIPADVEAEWDRDAKEQLEEMAAKDALKQIAKHYKVMMCSAQVFIGGLDKVVVGYKIKTGAVHEILGILKRFDSSVFLPAKLPELTQSMDALENIRLYTLKAKHRNDPAMVQIRKYCETAGVSGNPLRVA